MLTVLLILRILHISAGAFWSGVAVYNAFFVLPAAKALGPDGGKFMRQLMGMNNLPTVLTIVSTTTVVTGIILLTILSGYFSSSWFLSLHGGVLTLGAFCAVVAYGIGFVFNRPISAKLALLNQQISKQGSPTEEQKLQIRNYSVTLSKSTTAIAFFLITAVLGMSAVRYL